jgi:hypothetical protein
MKWTLSTSFRNKINHTVFTWHIQIDSKFSPSFLQTLRTPSVIPMRHTADFCLILYFFTQFYQSVAGNSGWPELCPLQVYPLVLNFLYCWLLFRWFLLLNLVEPPLHTCNRIYLFILNDAYCFFLCRCHFPNVHLKWMERELHFYLVLEKTRSN